MPHTPRRVLRLMTLLALLTPLAGAGCGIFGPSEDKDDDFSDTLQPKTADIYQFDVSENGGAVVVRITALSDSNVTLGIALGTFAGTACSTFVNANNIASTLNRQAINTPINKGTFCLQVYDNGTLTAPVTYTVRVTHP
jgi:hypothetical protein